jgi:hypothetical protein
MNEDSSPATTILVLEDADEGLRVVKRAEIAAPPFSFGAPIVVDDFASEADRVLVRVQRDPPLLSTWYDMDCDPVRR